MPSKIAQLSTLAATLLFAQACATGSGGNAVDPGLKPSGPDKFTSKRNLLTNNMPRNQDRSINVVVEIPAGTSEKWYVSDDGHALLRDYTGDKPRVIDYLPYPGNYGFVPRTLLGEDRGGDGSALDVLVLGPAVPRGAIIRARPIGVIRVVDRMEQDDKLLAIMEGGTMQGVLDIESLNRRYPGVSEIVGTWFANAHGKRSKVQLMGTGSVGQANSVLEFGIESWQQQRMKDRQ